MKYKFEIEFPLSPKEPREPLPPPSTWMLLQLIATNTIALGFALSEHWPLMLLLLPYWLQSVVVGGFARSRIRALRQFSVAGLSINGKAATESTGTRDTVANFLPLHFGLFCLVHAIFLIGLGQKGRFGDLTGIGAWDALNCVLVCVLFVFAQSTEHRRNLEADRDRRPSLGLMLFLPYFRVVPMHLTILFAGGSLSPSDAVLLFGVLKMIADVGTFVVSHYLAVRAAPAMTPDAPVGAADGAFGAAIRQRLARTRERMSALQSRTERRER